MWKCPKCGREFQRINQGHYCGKAPANVSEYIESQELETHAHLTQLRNILLNSVLGVREGIAWSMPRYKKGNFTVSFAACKNHVSLYIELKCLEYFKSQLNDFVIKKNAIYLPYNKELPIKLLEDIVKVCFEEK